MLGTRIRYTLKFKTKFLLPKNTERHSVEKSMEGHKKRNQLHYLADQNTIKICTLNINNVR